VERREKLMKDAARLANGSQVEEQLLIEEYSYETYARQAVLEPDEVP